MWPIILFVAVPAATIHAADDGRAADEAAIREATAHYVEAVSKGDVDAMLASWTQTGDFVDDTGETFNAQELIRSRQANPGGEAPPKLSVKSSQIRFLGPDAALEDGVSLMHREGDLPPVEGRYSAVWVKRDGKWLLDAVRELPIHNAAETTPLSGLQWMVGTWRAEHDGQVYDVTTRWNDYHTYLIREFKVTKQNQPVMSGVQIIGWDPAAKSVRAWVFDAAGGFSESQWTLHGDTWSAQSSGVLPDGRETHALNLHSYDGTTWVMKSCNSCIGDEHNDDLLLVFTRVPNS